MFGTIRTFFEQQMTLSREAPAQDRERALQVATCALLLEAALVDAHLAEEEIAHLREALRNLFDLDDPTLDTVLDLARKELDEAIDLWQFTNLINQHYTPEEKIQLLEHICRVVFSDGKLTALEAHLLSKLRTLLRLSHSQWVEARRRARVHLGHELSPGIYPGEGREGS